MTKALAGLAVLVLGLAGPRPASVAAQTITAAQASAVDKLFEAPDRDEGPGCTVEVRNDGQPVIGRSFGLANLEWRMPVRRFTLFEVGSISKQFTAAAIAILSIQGKLSLDDEVHRFLPELPDYGAPVTLRQMLTHTSGLREWGDIEEMNNRRSGAHVHTQADVLRVMARVKTLNFRPGTQFLYSNSNYNLLAIVVERASGMSFADFTTKTLFEPLDMSDTRWRTDFTAVVEQRAQAYAKNAAGEQHLAMPFENVVGAGGLISSVPDLMLWNEELAAPKPENAAWVAMIQQPGRLADGRAIPYALGLFVLRLNGVSVVLHGGGTGGYRAFLARIPSKRISAAILCNGAQFDLSDLGTMLLGVFVDASPDAVAATIASAATTIPLPPPGPPWAPAARDLAAFAGTYSSGEAETVFRAAVRGDRLVLTDDQGNAGEMKPLSQDVFRYPGTEWVMTFTRNGAGAVTGFGASTPRTRNLRFDRAVPAVGRP